MARKPEPPPLDISDMKYATAYDDQEDLQCLLVASSKQRLAAAWLKLAGTRLDMSKVDEVEINLKP